MVSLISNKSEKPEATTRVRVTPSGFALTCILSSDSAGGEIQSLFSVSEGGLRSRGGDVALDGFVVLL